MAIVQIDMTGSRQGSTYLLNEWLHLDFGGAVENRSKCNDGCFSLVPIDMLYRKQILLNKPY